MLTHQTTMQVMILKCHCEHTADFGKQPHIDINMTVDLITDNLTNITGKIPDPIHLVVSECTFVYIL